MVAQRVEQRHPAVERQPVDAPVNVEHDRDGGICGGLRQFESCLQGVILRLLAAAADRRATVRREVVSGLQNFKYLQ